MHICPSLESLHALKKKKVDFSYYRSDMLIAEILEYTNKIKKIKAHIYIYVYIYIYIYISHS